jgi:DNA-binding CsgD family transcriptional regulator
MLATTHRGEKLGMRQHTIDVRLDDLRRVMPLRCSPRQAQVLILVAHGFPDKEIAVRLGISPHTVRAYLDRFMRENKCHNRAEAAAVWLSNQGPGLVSRGLRVPRP